MGFQEVIRACFQEICLIFGPLFRRSRSFFVFRGRLLIYWGQQDGRREALGPPVSYLNDRRQTAGRLIGSVGAAEHSAVCSSVCSGERQTSSLAGCHPAANQPPATRRVRSSGWHSTKT